MAGCGSENDKRWVVRREPETATEREAVERMVVDLMSHFPSSVAGDDQDYDDAITEAGILARESCCKRRRYEQEQVGPNWTLTGRMEECP